ncbi:hypothetical protein NQ315_005480 [Exocentrus adspersus]|uniref:Tyrosine specific protein phosphatases domain-containing protein n=1 Tax=Exocentrus adspersus TaxID=1586481 RepID=A0AAV8VST8_9CUCU|nr:hypothetical protein NQ315_005480 [Exocentrus adspersus]
MSFKKKFSRGPLPDKWLHCPPNGNRLILSKFMPLKTPLSSDFDHQLPAGLRHYPQDIFRLARRNKVRIGLWIDLTNTNRYYRREEIQEEGCEYVKIRCKGHNEAPTESDTQFFISVVHEYIVKAPHQCIAVHCTHGFNRTGFLITAFLVEQLKIDVGTALQIFSEARPPGIYKQVYIKELFRRYGNVENVPRAPSLPKWCQDLYDHNQKHVSKVITKRKQTVL